MPKKSPWIYLIDITQNDKVISYKADSLLDLSRKCNLSKSLLNTWLQTGNDLVHTHKYLQSVHLRRVPAPRAPRKPRIKVPTHKDVFLVSYKCGDHSFHFEGQTPRDIAEHLKISLASVYKLLKGQPLPKLAFFKDLRVLKQKVPIEPNTEP